MSHTSKSTVFGAIVALAAMSVATSAALAQERTGSPTAREAGPARQSDNERLRELAKPGLRWGALSEKDLVPPEEREALGVDNTAWTRRFGKIHPDVYKSLEKAEQVTEPWLDVSGHTGTVYVQVQLKHEQRGKADSAENKAAVKEPQRRVLSQLTAAEFYTEYTFQTLPGILGYATRAAVEKLKANPEVVAVCLDDKPLVRSARITTEDLPPSAPGEAPTRAPGSKVHPDVYRAIALKERAFVIIRLKDSLQDQAHQEQRGTARKLEQEILSALTADQFWVVSRSAMDSVSASLLGGLVDSAGVRAIEAHPLLELMVLDQRMQFDPESLRGRP
jgi:hypothetical protein